MYDINYDYLRPLKAENLRERHEKFPDLTFDIEVWRGNNAVVLPARRGANGFLAGVLDENGLFLSISGASQIKNGYEIDECESKELKVVYCGYLIKHWGHFLVETAARLWYFLENDESVDKYVFTVDENDPRQPEGNYKEFLELLGILDKSIIINRPTRFKEVIVPDLAYKNRIFCSKKFLSVFDKVSENAKPSSDFVAAKKVFLSRTLFSKGRNLEFGGELMDDFWKENGYTVLYPERISLADTICYLKNAESVASISGTLPHNILFGRQGQQLVICERGAINNDWQVGINIAKELSVTYIDANYALYMVEMTGPFILGYTEHFERYKNDNGLNTPSKDYGSDKYRTLCFKRYMKSYRQRYRYFWYAEPYLLDKVDYHAESYREAREVFREFLDGNKPIFWYDCFEVQFLKKFVKRMIGNLLTRK